MVIDSRWVNLTVISVMEYNTCSKVRNVTALVGIVILLHDVDWQYLVEICDATLYLHIIDQLTGNAISIDSLLQYSGKNTDLSHNRTLTLNCSGFSHEIEKTVKSRQVLFNFLL